MGIARYLMAYLELRLNRPCPSLTTRAILCTNDPYLVILLVYRLRLAYRDFTVYSLIVMNTKNTIRLTAREAEVLTLIGHDGMSAKECADTLVVSKRTVDFHLANIFEKLSCNNRVKAYRVAVDMGLMVQK